MFKISTRGDYGLLLLSTLASKIQTGATFVSLREVAEEKKLPLPYLEQIVIPLKRAGLIESREGRDGGYRLARAPKEITMMEVLEVLEGPVEPVRCCGNEKGKCGSESYCNVKSSWQDAQSMLIQFFKNRTLEDTLPSNICSTSKTSK